VRRLALDRLLDDRLEVAGNLAIEPVQRRRRLIGHLLDQAAALLLVERRAEGEHLVERQAQRVDVAPAVDLAAERLGGHVPQGAEDVTGVGEVLLVVRLGQAEVGDPDDAARVEQQVGRLDVAVDDPLDVRVGQGIGHLDTDPRHPLPVGLPPGLAPGRFPPGQRERR
jgi:hypothetical protein